tara:strand:+ start:1073 stop:2473 length:1401 start_codon:yes stop_codon:yes gene_type:complete
MTLLHPYKQTIFWIFVVSIFISFDVTRTSEVTTSLPLPVKGATIVPSSGDLPLFEITTKGTIVNEPKVDGILVLKHKGEILFEGFIGIEIRGKSSQFFAKKSYGFETRDSENHDLKVSLLGFPKEADWILYGPYTDKSLIRNLLVFDLARDMGRYASRCELVELSINDTYKGIYVFMEKLKRDDGRIDINRLEPQEIAGEDLTGGYILKIDKVSSADPRRYYGPENSFESLVAPLGASSGQTINFLYEYPDAEDIVPAQREYISNYVAQFEAALDSDAFTDPRSGYANYIDTDSFIDFFILNELANNVDGYRLSTYIYKDRNGKLKAGPLWDFNLGFGNADYCSGGATNVWAFRFNERCADDFYLVPFWWDRLLQDPEFTRKLQLRWYTLRAGTLSNDVIQSKIDAYVAKLEKQQAVERNFDTWKILGIYVSPNSFVGNTYGEEVTYLKSWTNDRLSWLDGAINAL